MVTGMKYIEIEKMKETTDLNMRDLRGGLSHAATVIRIYVEP